MLNCSSVVLIFFLICLGFKFNVVFVLIFIMDIGSLIGVKPFRNVHVITSVCIYITYCVFIFVIDNLFSCINVENTTTGIPVVQS